MNREHNIRSIATEILINRETTIKWCQENSLLPKSWNCSNCGRNITKISKNNGLGCFRCQKKDCKTSVSVAKNTWFESSKLRIDQIILFSYEFSRGNTKYFEVKHECKKLDKNETITNTTISNWLKLAREVCMQSLDKNYENCPLIDGNGHVVQIDETKVGKRKYNRGRIRDGSRILGMIDDMTGELRLEICLDNRRDAKTLIPLIKKHVAPGTLIMSDKWLAYNSLKSEGYLHQTVTHKTNFINPETGAHTQKIESNWWALKRQLNKGVHKDYLASHLCEYLWRRHHKIKKNDLFTQFLKDISEFYPGI